MILRAITILTYTLTHTHPDTHKHRYINILTYLNNLKFCSYFDVLGADSKYFQKKKKNDLHHEIELDPVHLIPIRTHTQLHFVRRADIMSFLHYEIKIPYCIWVISSSPFKTVIKKKIRNSLTYAYNN